jgi:tRNA A-37 threonylcarbamoyl transferase component Bud32
LTALCKENSRLIDRLTAALMSDSGFLAEFGRFGHAAASSPAAAAALADFLFAVDKDPHEPDEIFRKLRWGGQLVYISRDAAEVAATATRFADRGYLIVQPPAFLRDSFLGLRLSFLGRKLHYFVARKVTLVLPREFSDRFTYQVELHPPQKPGEPWSVLKQIPAPERVAARLRKRFPDVTEEIIQKRVRKFTEKIFPVFLTREAAMLKIVEKNLPAEYAGRFPKVLDLEKDDAGFVRKLRMTWLRNSLPRDGGPLSQVEFARQAAELLHVLHDVIGVIHLDLRLDNIVITERGVGFVDFGSSVRVGEDLSDSPLLSTIFDELMRTSEIQRMLEKMTLSGTVTSPIFEAGYQKVDKTVDFFYLALQVNNPLSNPDFQGLVVYDPSSDAAKALRKLTDETLKPGNLNNPRYRTAADFVRGVQRIEQAGV